MKKRRKGRAASRPARPVGKSRPRRSRTSARNARSTEQPAAESADAGIIVVGVGASAGGLEAFTQLLEALPREPGFALVLVQHLAPQHESALPVLLSGRTDLQVEQATEGMRVERDHIYVIPPNVQMGIRDGRLHLMPRPSDRSQYTPIDFFLRSLAESVQERAIAVILSGTASDGTLGVREIKTAGGITIAQTPETAKYDGMPRTAIASGQVDLVLSPADIGHELVRIARHPLRRAPRDVAPTALVEQLIAPAEEDLEQIFGLLRTTSGVDFRRYKRPTITRRLQRRMVLHKLTSVEQYLKLLRETPGEVDALYNDILIHVTHFFREPESFGAVSENVLPKIYECQQQDQPIRIWVPGCSTGEEAYSIAIVVLEFLDAQPARMPVQVFATDVSDPAIEHARSGFYSAGIVSDVSPERLRRFFTKVDAGYRISKSVRDLCVFARQDVTHDPPFSRLDLIVCRNVLIYLGNDLQKRLMAVFHYALKPTGFLVLGAAETIGIHSDLFSVADKKHRIYEKRLVSTRELPFPVSYPGSAPSYGRRAAIGARDELKSVQGEANRLVQERYAPAGVIVDGDLHIVQFRGQTGAFLEPAPGDPSMNLLKMAREGLLHGLRSALQEARRRRAPVQKDGIRVRRDGGWREIGLEVFPLSVAERPHFLVMFTDRSTDVTAADKGETARRRERRPAVRPGRASQQSARLQRELASSREYLQSIIQELEAANEELQSANEEVLSSNEELQSTNEELDTAKEELQSTNEELNTVNEELAGRNEELAAMNSDLVNLLANVQIAIVMVGSDLRIRRFTPMAERMLNLLPGDVGRPIGHIKPNVVCPDLEKEIIEVIDTVTPVEREVQDLQGNWFSLRIRPYKSVENRIEGAVLSLFDVHAARLYEEHLRQARDYARAIVQTVRQPLMVLDGDLRVQTVNRAFCEAFAVSDAESEGHLVYELGDGQWDIGVLRARLESVLGGEPSVAEFEVRHDFPSGPKTIRLNARRIELAGARQPLVLVVVEEVSDQHGRPGSTPARVT